MASLRSFFENTFRGPDLEIAGFLDSGFEEAVFFCRSTVSSLQELRQRTVRVRTADEEGTFRRLGVRTTTMSPRPGTAEPDCTLAPRSAPAPTDAPNVLETGLGAASRLLVLLARVHATFDISDIREATSRIKPVDFQSQGVARRLSNTDRDEIQRAALQTWEEMSQSANNEVRNAMQRIEQQLR
jgi:hypothetical protein